ncbi:MAG: cobalamin B12-binding domain-containing protein [Thermodesulfobacteriota bacterium]
MTDPIPTIMAAVRQRRTEAVAGLIRDALAQGAPPEAILERGLVAGLDAVGRDFAQKAIFVPEMLISAAVVKQGLELLRPLLSRPAGGGRGLVLLATVKGDLHDIGKNILAMMLEGAGYRVVDLGVNVPAAEVVARVAELRPDAVGLSALLTITMSEMGKVVEGLRRRGLREGVKVMVGGAPVDALFARRIGADLYCRTPREAVERLAGLLAGGGDRPARSSFPFP